MKSFWIIMLYICAVIIESDGNIIKHSVPFGDDNEYFMTVRVKKLFTEFYSKHYSDKPFVNIVMLGGKTIKATAVIVKIIHHIRVSSVKLSCMPSIGQNAVFFMDDIRVLKKYFRNLVVQHHGKYTIIIADKVVRGSGKAIHKKKLYREAFQFLWTERLVHDVTILEFNKRSIDINFYLPFSDKKIASVRMFKSEAYFIFSKMKNRRLFNASGYPLKVSIFPNPPLTIPITELISSENVNRNSSRGGNKYAGINGRYMGEIARLLNFTLVEFEPADGLEYGFVMNNGTPVGALGDVALHRADIGGNARFPIDPIPDKVRYMVPPLYNDLLCVLVPAAIPESNWGRIMSIKLRLFTILSGTVVLTSIILFTVQLKKYTGARWENCCRAFTDLLNIFFGVPLSRLFTFSSTAERILISSCLIFALVLLSVSQSLVMSSLNVVDVREIDTLNDLFESRLEILTNYPSVKNLFKDVGNLEVRRLYSHLNLVSSYREEMLRRTELKRDVGMVTSATVGRLEEKVSRDRLGGDRPGVHLVKECTHVFYNFYLLPSGSPYRDVFTRLTGIFQEAGLPALWLNEGLSGLGVQHHGQESSDRKASPFSLRALQMPFCLLIGGLLAATFVFTLELLWHYCSTARHATRGRTKKKNILKEDFRRIYSPSTRVWDRRFVAQRWFGVYGSTKHGSHILAQSEAVQRRRLDVNVPAVDCWFAYFLGNVGS